MPTIEAADDLVRRLAAAVRAVSLYAPTHPLVERGVEGLAAACARALQASDQTTVGFIGDDVIVDGQRLPRSAASLVGFARDLRDREIEKITIARGVTREDMRAFVRELADRRSEDPLTARLDRAGLHRIAVGRIVVHEDEAGEVGIDAARRLYSSAMTTSESLWDAARAGDKPDPAAARKIVGSLARLVNQDRTSLMALTALKEYDNYTFTHMVNVAVLAMSLARSLNIDGAMLREFGLAALMHDIGKVNTPRDVLNKPDRLSRDEFAVMKRHVIDGAHILRRTPEMPALAPVVAFEHHLKQDFSGYPENIGTRKLNLCTMVVSIVDVYDALRSHRIYRQGLATDRVRAIMSQQDSAAFNRSLLRRFINLMGLFPVGTLVRLSTDELAVVTHEHPSDPFRPQVKIIRGGKGDAVEEPFLVNTWEPDGRGEYPRAVVEAADPEKEQVDPLQFLNATKGNSNAGA